MSQTPRGIGGAPLKSVKPASFPTNSVASPDFSPGKKAANITMSREKSDIDPLSLLAAAAARPPLPPPPSASKSDYSSQPAKPSQSNIDSPVSVGMPPITPQKLLISTSVTPTSGGDPAYRPPVAHGTNQPSHGPHPMVQPLSPLPLPQLTPDQFGRDFLLKCGHTAPVVVNDDSPLDIPTDIDGQLNLLCDVARKRNWRHVLSLSERILRLHEDYTCETPKSSLASSSFSNPQLLPVQQQQSQPVGTPVPVLTEEQQFPVKTEPAVEATAAVVDDSALESKQPDDDGETESGDASFSSTSSNDGQVNDDDLTKMDDIGVTILTTTSPAIHTDDVPITVVEHIPVEKIDVEAASVLAMPLPVVDSVVYVSPLEIPPVRPVSSDAAFVRPRLDDSSASRLSLDSTTARCSRLRVFYVKCISLYQIHQFELVLNSAFDEMQKFISFYLHKRNPECDKNQINSFVSRTLKLDGKFINLDSIQSKWIHFIDSRNFVDVSTSSVVASFDFSIEIWLIVAWSLLMDRNNWIDGVRVLLTLKDRIDRVISSAAVAVDDDPLSRLHCDDEVSCLWIWRRRVCCSLIAANCRVKRWSVAVELMNQLLSEYQAALAFIDGNLEHLPADGIKRSLCLCIARQITEHTTLTMNRKCLCLVIKCSTLLSLIDVFCKTCLIIPASNSSPKQSSRYINQACHVLDDFRICSKDTDIDPVCLPNLLTMLLYGSTMIQNVSSILSIGQGNYMSCLKSIGSSFDGLIGTANKFPEFEIDWKNAIKFIPFPSVEVDSNLVQSLANNFSISCFYSGQLDKSLSIMERLVTNNPYRFLNDATSFNLCAMYNEMHDVGMSIIKKRGLYLAASGLGIEDIETRAFQMPEDSAK